MGRPKQIVLLGATGSIGSTTLRVIRHYPEELQLVGISANQSVEALGKIAREFKVGTAVLSNGASGEQVPLEGFPVDTRVESGAEALCQLAAHPEADIVVVALVGAAGLLPTIAAIEAGKTVVLANKEVLVMAGEWVMRLARERGVDILPADSEHNAIFQCLDANPDNLKQVEKVILTASGGPFRETPIDALGAITPEQALRHPNWDMGAKNSLDSATMANKGLELIEAKWLFDLEPDQLQVAIHPESIIHGMIQYRDGSVIAQMCPTDMTYPLQHCLFYPRRLPPVVPKLDWSAGLNLNLTPPDPRRFPCLQLAQQALAVGLSAPCTFNAANEIAGMQFLEGRIPFLKIPWVIDKTLEKASIYPLTSLEAIQEADREARELAKILIKKHL